MENVDEKEYIHKCTYNKLTKEDVIDELEYSNVSALIWFNKKKEIIKMVLYGSTTIMDDDM